MLRQVILFLVEMRRIELLSESIVSQLSPSAVCILFSKHCRLQTGCNISISMVFPYNLRELIIRYPAVGLFSAHAGKERKEVSIKLLKRILC